MDYVVHRLLTTRCPHSQTS